jgi:hypothetical protein
MPWITQVAYMKIFISDRKFFLVLITFTFILTIASPVLAASTQLHIVKYANDGTAILAEKTLTFQEMESTLPVQGDGSTHYYLQGPVFVDDPDAVTEEQLRWNPLEDTNVQEKDMGAVKGTDVKDLCNLVGGMSPGDSLKIRASDGMTKDFAYKNVYTPPARQGPMVITWFKDGHYPDSGYDEGMRLLFFADTSVNPWGAHVFGNYDWHESAEQQYWYYYYQSSDEKYPTTTGLSVKDISDLLIYSSLNPSSGSGGSGSWGGGVTSSVGIPSVDDASMYGFKGSKLTTYASGTLNGTIRLMHDPRSTPVVISNRIRDYTIPLLLQAESNLTLARLYVYISGSHGIQSNAGITPSLKTEFNHVQLDTQQLYIDTDGDEHRNVSATYAFDVLPYMKGNDTYTISLANPDYDQAVFTVEDVALAVAFENESAPSAQYWIGEGCDVLSSNPRRGILPDDATTTMAFTGTLNISRISDATLMVVSTGIDSLNTTEHMVKFNNGTWYNAFDNASIGDTLQIPVKPYLNGSGNSASIESTIRRMDGDYLVNRNVILVIEQNASTGATDETDPADMTSGTPVLPDSAPSPVNNLTPESTPPPCSLSLHTNPEGALIFVDGSYLGKTTPYVLEGNPGDQHTIRFELDGFVPAERNLTMHNDTTLYEYLYANVFVYSAKGRSVEQMQERDTTRHGSLYVKSRPGPAVISINGIKMPQRTPAIISSLKEGLYTVRLSLEPDPFSKGNSGITFEDQEVYVYPYSTVPVDVAANTSRSEELIIDSGSLRGEPFTVNGHTVQKTIPARIHTPSTDSFITLFHNLSYISYPVPAPMNEDHYLVIEPRQHNNLTMFVDSSPRGAEVFIDGFRTGYSTPFTFTNISDGSHRIMVSKPGYIPEESLITLLYTNGPESKTEVRFSLDEYTNGFLRVGSNTPGSAIFIDGLDTGEVTSYLFSSVPIGTHSITVSSNNSTRKYPDVVVNALIPVNISADFIEIPQH